MLGPSVFTNQTQARLKALVSDGISGGRFGLGEKGEAPAVGTGICIGNAVRAPDVTETSIGLA